MMMKVWLESNRHVLQASKQLVEEFGLPKSFFTDLSNIDDWLFVVRSHALLETITTWAITEAVKPLPLEDFIVKLPLSGGGPSKLRLARTLELVDQDDEKFVKALAQLRNKLAHNIRHVEFQFQGFFAPPSGKEKEEILRGLLSHAVVKGPTTAGRKEQPSEIRGKVWIAVVTIMTCLVLRKRNVELKQQAAASITPLS